MFGFASFTASVYCSRHSPVDGVEREMEIAERTTRSTSFHIAYEGVTLIEVIVTERRGRQRQKKESRSSVP